MVGMACGVPIGVAARVELAEGAQETSSVTVSHQNIVER
jgi:hypothetical protein